MASSDSQIDKPQRGRPKRAELPDVNLKTQARKALILREHTYDASISTRGNNVHTNEISISTRTYGGEVFLFHRTGYIWKNTSISVVLVLVLSRAAYTCYITTQAQAHKMRRRKGSLFLRLRLCLRRPGSHVLFSCAFSAHTYALNFALSIFRTKIAADRP